MSRLELEKVEGENGLEEPQATKANLRSIQPPKFKSPALNASRVYRWMLRKLFSHPALVVIIGNWKTGKTDLALRIAEDVQELGLIKLIASNIYCYDDPRIQQITAIETMRFWLHKTNRLKLLIIDEANLHFTSRRSMSKLSVDTIKLLPELSKGHARMIVIAQEGLTIDREFLNQTWVRALIEKENLKTMCVYSHLWRDRIRFRDIPRTTVRFDPYANAPLEAQATVESGLLDDDLRALYRYSYEDKSAREQGVHPEKMRRLIKKFLRDNLKPYIHKSQVNAEEVGN